MLIGVDASRVTRARRTGTENYSLEVLRQLLPRDQRNTYRLYFNQPPQPNLLPRPRSTQHRVIRLPRLWTQVGLSREMLLNPPDLLFVPSHVLPLVTPRRSVVVVYDVGHRHVPAAHPPLERLYLEWSIRRHVRLASQIVTISQAARSDLVRLFGADPVCVTVAPPAADQRFAPPGDEAVARVRARYQLPTRYVLHLGTMKPRKNLPRLVRAFAQAPLPPDVGLILAGQVPRGGPVGVLEAAKQAGILSRVRLVAYPDDADLPALYAGAQAVAIASLHEGFGMPAIEALACGAPVLASNRGALPEVVGDDGVLVDPLEVGSIAEGLGRIVNDSALRASLRQRGPERARHFSWEETGRAVLAALERAGGR